MNWFTKLLHKHQWVKVTPHPEGYYLRSVIVWCPTCNETNQYDWGKLP